MKRLLACLSAVILVVTACTVCLAEETEPIIYSSGDWEYILPEDDTAVIHKYTGNDETVIIPEELGGKKVTGIGDEAFFMCSSLTGITIPDSVTNIGNNPFLSCINLKEMIISPDHPYFEVADDVLFSKPDHRLVCCLSSTRKTSYEIPQGTQIIGHGAFSCCVHIESILIPDSVTEIGDGAFASCFSLTDITIPENITSIGDLMFYSCYSLTSMTIPDSVTSIGFMAFSSCDAMTDITIPKGVTSIGYQAFSHCDSLIITVSQDSYAARYCRENGLKCVYSEADD